MGEWLAINQAVFIDCLIIQKTGAIYVKPNYMKSFCYNIYILFW